MASRHEDLVRLKEDMDATKHVIMAKTLELEVFYPLQVAVCLAVPDSLTTHLLAVFRSVNLTASSNRKISIDQPEF